MLIWGVPEGLEATLSREILADFDGFIGSRNQVCVFDEVHVAFFLFCGRRS